MKGENRFYLIASRISEGICFLGDLLRLEKDKFIDENETKMKFTFDDELLNVCVANDQDFQLHHKSLFRVLRYWLWFDWHQENFSKISFVYDRRDPFD